MKEFRHLIEEINKLKKQKNAVILVHNYQKPEIYEVADFLGDSLELSRKAAETDKDIIVFCGVDFMAETAKILNPEKKVLLPAPDAKCPMAAMITAEKLRNFKDRFPKAAVVCYINTSAEVKAESDICCTSANAVEVVNSLKEREVIFVPDENLADYVQTKTDKKIISWPGYCYVHSRIKPAEVMKAKQMHPNAKVFVHPECPLEVISLGDAVCSTSQMVDYVLKSGAKEFIVCTEEGMVNRLKRERKDAKYYPVGSVCLQMKKNSLESVKEALIKEQHVVEVSEKIRIKAKKAVDRMLEITQTHQIIHSSLGEFAELKTFGLKSGGIKPQKFLIKTKK